ncbi:MAG: multicopper oxidase domain-containing protein [Blastocatellia bacterium]
MTKQESRQRLSEDSNVSRRRFLTAGTGMAAGWMASSIMAPGQSLGQSAAPANRELFSEPRVEYSRSGTLRTLLRVVEADVAIREDSRLRVERTRCYNGQVPGPTLRIRSGDNLRIRLINNLTKNPDSSCGHEHLNRPHCFNTTNIHTHGLHVSPQAPSDDPFLKIEPQADYEYCFQVPEFHPAGTFWYHAHVHGSTGLQVMNGLAGALIIEEPEGQQVAREAKDVVWMIQEIMGREAEKLYSCGHPHSLSTVNGKVKPGLRMRPGEVQRWRFINATATPGGYAILELLDGNDKPQEISVIAIDGYPLRRMRKAKNYNLPPGGRVDFLVRVMRPGQYRMFKKRFQGQSQDQELAFIDVEGKPANMKLPERLPPLSSFLDPINDNEISRRRTVRFQICPDQARGDTCKHFPDAKVCSGDEPVNNAFLIDGKSFDPDRIDHSIKLGTAEEWEIINETGAEHPFHIHINHFQEVREGVAPKDWIWRDTISLPKDGAVKIRSRFRNYPGRFLLHCHILLHSDLGMMQTVEVVGKGIGPCRPA